MDWVALKFMEIVFYFEAGLIRHSCGTGNKKSEDKSKFDVVQDLYKFLQHGRDLDFNSGSVFGYLDQQNVGTDQDRVNACKKELEEKYGMCKIGHNFKTSILLPIWGKRSSRDGYLGTIGIRGRIVEQLMLQANNNTELIAAMIRYPEGTVLGSGRLCKNDECEYYGHSCVASRDRRFCPSYWIVNGTLTNFCECDGEKCLAPGNMFKRKTFLKKMV